MKAIRALDRHKTKKPMACSTTQLVTCGSSSRTRGSPWPTAGSVVQWVPRRVRGPGWRPAAPGWRLKPCPAKGPGGVLSISTNTPLERQEVRTSEYSESGRSLVAILRGGLHGIEREVPVFHRVHHVAIPLVHLARNVRVMHLEHLPKKPANERGGRGCEQEDATNGYKSAKGKQPAPLLPSHVHDAFSDRHGVGLAVLEALALNPLVPDP
jgi:hypothetical protein